MLSISESIYHHNDNKGLFKKFVPHMGDKTWFIPRGSNTTLSDHDIAIDLFHTRDALAHQLSLPNHIGLINTKAEAKQYFKDYTATSRVISVTEFVEAVEETVEQIIKSHPNAIIDPRGFSRTPGVRVELSDGSSASKIG